MINFLIIAAQVGMYSGAFQLFSVGTLAVTVTDFAMILFSIAVIVRLLWYGEKIYLHKSAPFIFFWGVLGAVILSGITPVIEGNPPGIQQYFKTVSHFLYLWLFTFFCCVLNINMKVWKQLIQTLIIASVFINLFGIYQIVARAYDLPFAWITMTNVSIGGRGANMDGEGGQLSLNFGSFYRATSIFSEPSALAGFNATILAYMLVPFSQGQRQFFKSALFNIFAFAAVIITLFLTFSLTGLLTGGVVVVASLIFGKRDRIFPVISALMAAVILIIVADTVVKSYTDISVADLFGTRISGIVDGRRTKETTGGESFFERLESIAIATKIWKDHPVNGIGLGRYAHAKQAIRGGYGFPDSTLAAALAELGIIGFICIAGMMFSATLHTFLLMRKKKFMAKLANDTRKIFFIIPYFLAIASAATFTSNSLVSQWMWLTVAFCIPVYHRALRESGSIAFKEFFLVSIPMKIRFAKILQDYFKTQPQQKATS